MPAKRKPRVKPASPHPRSQPETLRIRSVAAALTVSDITRSVAWYRDVLGFILDDIWEHEGRLAGVGLKAGTARLVLTQDLAGKQKRLQPKSHEFRLYFTTAQDLDQVAARVKERGGVLMSEPLDQPWGVRTFSLMDPDGFLMVISAAE